MERGNGVQMTIEPGAVSMAPEAARVCVYAEPESVGSVLSRARLR